MQFNQGEIAKIYGYKWEETDEGKKAFLRGKLEKLNKVANLQSFYGYLDLRNQRHFKKVLLKKLEGIL